MNFLIFFKSKFFVWNSIFLAFFCFFVSCSDDSSGTDYLFDREILELSALRSCPTNSDLKNCFQIRFRYPIETDHLESFLVWVDTLYVKDTVRSVSKEAKENPTFEIPYEKSKSSYYDTLDLTDFVKEYKERDSLQVAIWPKYSDNEDPGAVQRIFLHFKDDMAPSIISLQDSVFANGAVFDFARPTDQTDFYAPESISGKIAGYNLILYALNEEEDIRNIFVQINHAGITDSVGDTLYLRHHRFRQAKKDSVYLDTTSSKEKRYLRFAIIDGEGFSKTDSLNRFRIVLKGLKPESKYTIGITSFDVSGNYSGAIHSADMNQLFITTDEVPPVLPTKLFYLKDSLNPEYARLDSNNRLRIFFERSVDPFEKNHGIQEDSVLFFPDTCYEFFCYREVESYLIERYLNGSWAELSDAGGKVVERFNDKWEVSGDTFSYATDGKFLTDTIRFVLPEDTLILRVRAKDSSGYYSRALIDTIFIARTELGIECPENFLPVKTDSSVFCMEKFEHQDSSGNFMTNLLWSEALEVCESLNYSGFQVSLCPERDFELVCLSGGLFSYGVIEEAEAASEYLYTNCNVATNDSVSAKSIDSRNYKCANTFGIRDLPGQYQEWVKGHSEYTLQVLKGSSYLPYNGLDRESIALCTNRFFPYYTRHAYVKDTTVYLFRSGTVVDTTLVQDTSRTLYKKLTQKDFSDTLQFFDVINPETNEVVGSDYALLREYNNGGAAFMESISNGMIYKPSRTEIVFLLNKTIPYLSVSAFYKSPSVSFRCCAYPE